MMIRIEFCLNVDRHFEWIHRNLILKNKHSDFISKISKNPADHGLKLCQNWKWTTAYTWCNTSARVSAVVVWRSAINEIVNICTYFKMEKTADLNAARNPPGQSSVGQWLEYVIPKCWRTLAQNFKQMFPNTSIPASFKTQNIILEPKPTPKPSKRDSEPDSLSNLFKPFPDPGQTFSKSLQTFPNLPESLSKPSENAAKSIKNSNFQKRAKEIDVWKQKQAKPQIPRIQDPSKIKQKLS